MSPSDGAAFPTVWSLSNRKNIARSRLAECLPKLSRVQIQGMQRRTIARGLPHFGGRESLGRPSTSPPKSGVILIQKRWKRALQRAGRATIKQAGPQHPHGGFCGGVSPEKLSCGHRPAGPVLHTKARVRQRPQGGPRKPVKASWAPMLTIGGVSLLRSAVPGLLRSSTFELLLGRAGRAERTVHG